MSAPSLELFEDGYYGSRGLAFRECRSSATPQIRIFKARGVPDAAIFQLFFEKLLEEQSLFIILDCVELRYGSSVGLGTLVKHTDQIQQRGGEVVLCQLPKNWAIVVNMLGLESFFHISPTVSDGIALLTARLNKAKR